MLKANIPIIDPESLAASKRWLAEQAAALERGELPPAGEVPKLEVLGTEVVDVNVDNTAK